MLKILSLGTLSAVSVLAFVNPVQAVSFTLTNGSGANATYDTSGFTGWTIGSTNILADSVFYYRTGTGTGETLLTPDFTIADGTTTSSPVSGTFNGTDFLIDLNLALSSSGSTLTQTITVTNQTANPLDFTLFKYFEWNASNSGIEETAIIDPATFTATQSGQTPAVTQDTITTTVSQTGATVNERRAEIDALDFDQDIRFDRLNSGTDTTLGNIYDDGGIAPDNRDLTYAYQWNYNLAGGEAFTITLDSNSTLNTPPSTAVPEPSMVLATLMAGGMGVWYRRRQGQQLSS